MLKRLNKNDLRTAIVNDVRFRSLFPELKSEIAEVLRNPSCGCNAAIYNEFLKYPDRLLQYFSGYEIESTFADTTTQNHWKVINCKIDELESVLNGLHKIGPKQVAVARWQDQLTVIINDLGVFA